jgi:hypothetical protein
MVIVTLYIDPCSLHAWHAMISYLFSAYGSQFEDMRLEVGYKAMVLELSRRKIWEEKDTERFDELVNHGIICSYKYDIVLKKG